MELGGRTGGVSQVVTHTEDDAGMRNNECHKPTAPWVGDENSDESGVGRADGDITHYLYHFYNPKYT